MKIKFINFLKFHIRIYENISIPFLQGLTLKATINGSIIF